MELRRSLFIHLASLRRRLASERLIIFVKAPRPGLVKTRLAQRIGLEQAAVAYRLIVTTLMRNVSALDTVELHYSPRDAAGEIREWLRPGWIALPQREGDLGARLESAFAEAFTAGVERVVIVGSDCPSVTAEDVFTAWEALRTCDVVLGPAADGGYWLVGLRRPAPELFRNMRWSTEIVFEETVARAHRAGLSVHELHTRADIDTESDWREFVATINSSQTGDR